MTSLMAELAADAHAYKPRLFTIYGLFKHGLEDPEYLGWGMDFEELGATLYYDPASRETHTADNPDQILKFHERISGEVRLEWLDAE